MCNHQFEIRLGGVGRRRVQGAEGMRDAVYRLNAESWSVKKAGKLGGDIRAGVRLVGKAAHI